MKLRATLLLTASALALTSCATGPLTSPAVITKCDLPKSALLGDDSLDYSGSGEQAEKDLECILDAYQADDELLEQIQEKSLTWEETLHNSFGYQWAWSGRDVSSLRLRVFPGDSETYSEPPKLPLESAGEACGVEDSVTDGGLTLSLDGEGGDDRTVENRFKAPKYKVDTEEYQCLFTLLETPSSVTTMMSRTRALDGMQRESAGPYDYAWTYHPDNGLDVLVKQGVD